MAARSRSTTSLISYAMIAHVERPAIRHIAHVTRRAWSTFMSNPEPVVCEFMGHEWRARFTFLALGRAITSVYVLDVPREVRHIEHKRCRYNADAGAFQVLCGRPHKSRALYKTYPTLNTCMSVLQ